MPPKHLSFRNLTVTAVGALILIAMGVYLFNQQQGGIARTPNENATSTVGNATSTGLTPEQEAQIIDDYGLDLRAQNNLALQRKAAGDYAGAIEIWNRAGVTYPGNIISFNNLGDLYLTILKDYPKAEKAYLQVVKNSPGQLNGYLTLYEIYTQTTLKSEIAAKSILEQGIAANPKAFDLMVKLARIYREAGQNTQARAQYEAAIAAATANGQASAAASIQSELNTLPK
jgi:tetratricopeptide (TPR) repeat protein